LLFLAAVSVVVELAARQTAEASSARAEAATLSTVAGSVLEQLRETFGLVTVTLLEKHDRSGRIASAVGDRPATWPADGDTLRPQILRALLIYTTIN
jgi:two-component system, OmpR family, sensor histidine kinase KdpD